MPYQISDGRGNDLIIEQCCNCKIIFSMPKSMYLTAYQAKERMTFYCPHGHAQNYASGKTEEQKLRDLLDEERRKLDREKQNAAYLESEIEDQKRKTAYQKGLVTKLKNRTKAGLCTCCNRHFTNLERHMASKHGNEKAESEE